jgi:Kef-type K+ transport system membrane component KefB
VRSVFVYVAVVSIVAGAIAVLLVRSASDVLPAPAARLASPADRTLRTLLVQIVVTLICAHAAGALVRVAGQPRVVGEIAGGVLLGPTVLGQLSPGWFQAVFPAGSTGALKLVAEVGIVLFMFRVGLDVDLQSIRRDLHRAVVISHVSIAVPFLLGVAAAHGLYRTYAPAGTPFLIFALFIGIAMAITAFPVLARILTDRGLSATPVGRLALTCAAVDDMTAWILLAAIVSSAGAGRGSGFLDVAAASTIFVLVMVAIVRPLLRRVGAGETVMLVVAFAAAAATEIIGIHAIFGAFLAGVVVPFPNEGRKHLAERLAVVTPVLIPLFFAYVGLRTQLALLLDARTAAACAVVIAVATAGKLGATAAAARVTGMSWRDGLALGALMNTRGLMELVAVNIAYEIGIITAGMFTILVVMAVVTTVATAPLLTAFRFSGGGEGYA